MCIFFMGAEGCGCFLICVLCLLMVSVASVLFMAFQLFLLRVAAAACGARLGARVLTCILPFYCFCSSGAGFWMFLFAAAFFLVFLLVANCLLWELKYNT